MAGMHGTHDVRIFFGKIEQAAEIDETLIQNMKTNIMRAVGQPKVGLVYCPKCGSVAHYCSLSGESKRYSEEMALGRFKKSVNLDCREVINQKLVDSVMLS